MTHVSKTWRGRKLSDQSADKDQAYNSTFFSSGGPLFFDKTFSCGSSWKTSIGIYSQENSFPKLIYGTITFQ